jgi:hypothetical protein
MGTGLGSGSGSGSGANNGNGTGSSKVADDALENKEIPDSQHFLENSLKAILSPSQLSDLYKSFWKYEIKVNGEILPLDLIKDGIRIKVVSQKDFMAAKALESSASGSVTDSKSDSDTYAIVLGVSADSPESSTDSQNAKVIKVAAGDFTVKFSQIEKPRVLPVEMHVKGALGGGKSKDTFDKHLLITSEVNPVISVADGVASYSFKDLKAGQSFFISPDNILRSYIG